MKNEVKYIGFYSINNHLMTRAFSLAARNKMDYIISVLNQLNINTHIISPSWSMDTEMKYYKKMEMKIDDHTKLTLTPSFGVNLKMLKYLRILFSLGWLTGYLLLSTNKFEKIIVYHSPWMFFPIFVLKKLKKIKIILEIEEIHSSVWNLHPFLKWMEYKLIKISDRQIVVTEELGKKLKIKNPIVLHGDYTFTKKTKITRSDNLVKIIYAGSVEYVKGGAIKLIDIAKQLPSNYRISIIGPGDKSAIIKLNEKINLTNKELGFNKIAYEGIVHGKDLEEKLLSSDIGINSQKTGEYMGTAFPSKLLTYLKNGLRVVSTPNSTILNSKVNHLITFSKDDSCESIVNAILEVNKLNAFETEMNLNELHNDFSLKLNSFLKE